MNKEALKDYAEAMEIQTQLHGLLEDMLKTDDPAVFNRRVNMVVDAMTVELAVFIGQIADSPDDAIMNFQSKLLLALRSVAEDAGTVGVH